MIKSNQDEITKFEWLFTCMQLSRCLTSPLQNARPTSATNLLNQEVLLQLSSEWTRVEKYSFDKQARHTCLNKSEANSSLPLLSSFTQSMMVFKRSSSVIPTPPMIRSNCVASDKLIISACITELFQWTRKTIAWFLKWVWGLTKNKLFSWKLSSKLIDDCLNDTHRHERNYLTESNARVYKRESNCICMKFMCIWRVH